MKEYIREKKKILREFGFTKEEIESINWDAMRSEIHCDQVCRTAIMKHLGEN